MKESTLSDTQDHITKKAFPCLGIRMPGYVDLMEELNHKFPLSEPQIIGVQSQKDFIALFGTILRMRNLLLSFDEFKGNERISERDLQDYLRTLSGFWRDEWKFFQNDRKVYRYYR